LFAFDNAQVNSRKRLWSIELSQLDLDKLQKQQRKWISSFEHHQNPGYLSVHIHFSTLFLNLSRCRQWQT